MVKDKLPEEKDVCQLCDGSGIQNLNPPEGKWHRVLSIQEPINRTHDGGVDPLEEWQSKIEKEINKYAKQGYEVVSTNIQTFDAYHGWRGGTTSIMHVIMRWRWR